MDELTNPPPTNELPRRTSRLRSWLAEPFLHFVALGALTFGVHRSLQAPEQEPLQISSQVESELAALHEQRQGRAPNEAERASLRQRWIEDEVLFREGLRLGLVHTDAELRAEIIARVRALLQASVAPPEPSEAELAQFYERHRADYLQPAILSFREHVVRSGPDAGDIARGLSRALRTLPEAEAAELLRVPSSREEGSEEQLGAFYGPELARKLFSLEPGEWHELRSPRGIHLVKIEKSIPANDPGLTAVRAQVLADYKAEGTRRVFEHELARLQSRWRVDLESRP